MDEICRLCDHLIVLDQGKIAASGNLQSVLVRLDVPALAGDDAGALIAGKMTRFDEKFELSLVKCAAAEFWLPGNLGTIGDSLRLRIRASDISLCRDRPERSSILNLIDVSVIDVQDTHGPTQLVRIAAGKDELIARITRRSREEIEFAARRHRGCAS